MYQNTFLTTPDVFFNLWSGQTHVLMHFQATRIKSLKKIFFNLWSVQTRVLMHFLTTRIKSLKSYFLTSGEVKNVF
jgi:hypothetical protein